MSNIEEFKFEKISDDYIDKIIMNPFKMIGKDWMLITSGNKDSWNTMTASWGFVGIMWGKRCVTAMVRPQRYTREFIDNNEYFTISFFDEEYRQALLYCGKNSGRDVDKASETKLNPIKIDETVSFEQAKMILVCKKIYVQSMKSEGLIDKSINEQWYKSGDYHIAYYGEIVSVYIK